MEAQEIFGKLLEPEAIDDPYPLYAAVHELGGVLPAGGGVLPGYGQIIFVPAYEVANDVLRDPGYIVPGLRARSRSRGCSRGSRIWLRPARLSAASA